MTDWRSQAKDLRSQAKEWNEAAMRRIAARLDNPRPRWPLVAMLAIGLLAGAALGGYAVSQRGHLKRLTLHARRMRDGLAGVDTPDDDESMDLVGVPRSNHRRKATSEV